MYESENKRLILAFQWHMFMYQSLFAFKMDYLLCPYASVVYVSIPDELFSVT